MIHFFVVYLYGQKSSLTPVKLLFRKIFALRYIIFSFKDKIFSMNIFSGNWISSLLAQYVNKDVEIEPGGQCEYNTGSGWHNAQEKSNLWSCIE